MGSQPGGQQPGQAASSRGPKSSPLVWQNPSSRISQVAMVPEREGHLYQPHQLFLGQPQLLKYNRNTLSNATIAFDITAHEVSNTNAVLKYKSEVHANVNSVTAGFNQCKQEQK